MKTRLCKMCREEKPVTEFSPRKDSPIGYASRCKACRRELNKRKCYPIDKCLKWSWDLILGTNGRFRTCLNCGEEYSLDCFTFDSSKGLYLRTCKKCRATHSLKYNKLHPEDAKRNILRKPHRTWARSTLHEHKKQGFNIQISIDTLERMAIEAKTCYLCGIELDWSYFTKNRKVKPNSPTLDRVNNDKDIHVGNVRIACHKCNAAKGDKPLLDFVEYCRQIVGRFNDINSLDFR